MSADSESLAVPKDGGRPISSTTTLAGDAASSEKKLQEESPQDSESTSKNENSSNVGEMDEPDDTEYPSGFKLFFIVVALVMSIFLVSLDMVRDAAWLGGNRETKLTAVDYRRNRNPQDYR
jgi:hypothetical protein